MIYKNDTKYDYSTDSSYGVDYTNFIRGDQEKTVDTAFLRGGTGRSDENEPISLNIENYVKITPLARMAVPEDIVGPIIFLLGSDSRFMTGQTLWVNGGGYMP